MSAGVLASGLVLTIAFASIAGCRDGMREPPSELVDGSPARIVAIGLDGVDVPVVETRVQAARSHPCGDRPAPRGQGLERIGVLGSSVTTASMSGRVLRACDSTRAGEWCGQAFARVDSTPPVDARLSLTCTDDDGRPVGFAWLQPGEETTYVVVTHDEYAEAYRVRRRAPVRVASSRVDVATSSASFAVSEHDESGRRLRQYVLRPQVAD